jgi:hypothetical protein
MSDITGSLRSEIVESEKARIDLLKWKIILIAALGAVGFGMSREDAQPMPAVLGFIPLVCAYVDLVCVHNTLRILVIAHFLRTDATPAGSQAKAYEELCQSVRQAFLLEPFALVGTTILFSFFVAFIGLYLDPLLVMVNIEVKANHAAVRLFLVLAALVGALASIGAALFEHAQAEKLRTGLGLPPPALSTDTLTSRPAR